MATRRTLLSLSTGFFQRFTSVSRRPYLPAVSQISVQKAGILPSAIPPVRHFTRDASSSETDDAQSLSETGDVHPDSSIVYDKWIVVMSFPEGIPDSDKKDAFVRMAATVLKSSHEEAERKIYAMETKMYCGFHINTCQEIAKKFAEQSGVYQVLPDSRASK